MSDSVTFLVGLASDPQALVRRASELGLSPGGARWSSVGTLWADRISEWVGVTPVSGTVILQAPMPQPGDEPNTWLHFPGDIHANTSDLLALSVVRT